MGGFYTVRMRGDTRARLANSALAAGLIAFAINALTSNAFQHPRGAVFFFALVGLQAALGAPFWNLPAEETVRSGASRQSVWSRSMPGRVYAALERAVSGAWQRSVTRRLLLSRPLGAGELLSGSVLARSVIGDGAKSPERVSGATE